MISRLDNLYILIYNISLHNIFRDFLHITDEISSIFYILESVHLSNKLIQSREYKDLEAFL